MEQNNSNLIRGYSKAIFSVAIEYKAQEQFLLLLNFFNIVVQDIRVKKAIRNNEATSEEKANFLLDLINNKFASILDISIKTAIGNLIKLLAKTKHLLLIPKIFAEYDKLYLQYTNKVRIEITSAIDLDDHQKQSLYTNLTKYFNQEVLIDYQTNIKIIAGLIIKYADQIIDFSFKGKLLKLEQALKA